MFIVEGIQDEKKDAVELLKFLSGEPSSIKSFSGVLRVQDGKILQAITVINNRSIAEEVLIYKDNVPYSGDLEVRNSQFDSSFVFSGDP